MPFGGGGRGGMGGRRGGRGGGRGGGRRQTGRRMHRRRRRRMMLVGGLVAFGTYKMSTRDADRIKESTGKDPEDMTDEELEASMEQLDIEKQYRDADDAEIPAPTSAAAELEKLAAMHKDGLLSDAEFTQAKAKVLGS